MLRRTLCAVVGLMGLIASSAYGQCPADPNSVIAGTWGFFTEGVAYTGAASAGIFTASVTPGGVKQLAVTETANYAGFLLVGSLNGGMTRLASYKGRFTLNEDCTGGTLELFQAGHQLAFDFWFVNNRTEMFMVNFRGPSTAPGTVFRGEAKRI